MKILRVVAVASALVTGLALSACATSSGSAPSEAPLSTDGPVDVAEVHAAWLDAGRAVGLVTYGSSTCLPMVEDIAADGQNVTVALSDPADKPCTMDYVPRATLVTLPPGVDAAADIAITVTGAIEGTATLDGDDDLPGTVGEPTDFEPSAGWFDQAGFVVLTWGSSTCVPTVEGVEATGESALTVTFAELPADQACTMDVAPRLAIAAAPDGFDGEDDVTLTLAGGGVEGSTLILGDR